MKLLIVTVAGLSSRFSESVGYPCLKCLYYENTVDQSLLFRILHLNNDFDYYIVVGGFRYDELESALTEDLKELKNKILLVKNEHYADYGSGYSLYLALKEAMNIAFDEVVFAEGDLYVDAESFKAVCDSPNNVITCSREAIWADKSVVFYFDKDYHIHYIYDTAHSVLEIREPFLGIFNSGQIWKFADAAHLRKAMRAIGREEWQGTNLVLIQQYFGCLDKNKYDIVTFKKWINCNTVSDYRNIE